VSYTKSGISSFSSGIASALLFIYFPIISLSKPIYLGPKWVRISGSISATFFVSGLPITTKVLLWRDAMTSGLVKWMTVLSSLNILTSSIPGIGWTPNFLITVLSFLSSLMVVFTIAFYFLLWVPFPPSLVESPNLFASLALAS